MGLSNGQHIAPRVARRGLLTLFIGARGELPPVNEPSDEQAITHAFVAGRDWWPYQYKDAPPVQLCCSADRSNAGRYFFGALQLFGGLHEANRFLLHKFWREQLGRLGATDQRPERRLNETRTRLKRRLPNSPLDLTDQAHLDKLSDIVLQEADAIRLNFPSVEWTQLCADHERYVEADEENFRSTSNVDHEDWQTWQRDSLRKLVQSLCMRAVLHQGLEQNCDRCHHSSWVTIRALKESITCDICRHTEAAPVERPWQFRLNGFLRDALRSHGVGPLFWALSRMRTFNVQSMWFEGPTNIYLTKEAFERRPSTDVDLTVVTDGIVRMCEVKQSARSLTRISEHAELMKRLRPDIATIAVMEPLSSRLQGAFDRFAAALEGSGIEPELIAFEPDRDLRDDAFL